VGEDLGAGDIYGVGVVEGFAEAGGEGFRVGYGVVGCA
jgi:hypothetical protein